jgi:transcriptional regulator with XRE-family HTH domain
MLNISNLNSIDKNVGREIKKARLLLKMRQSDIANILGVSTTQVHKYEQGISSLSVDKIRKLCDTLGISLVKQIEDSYSSSNSALEHPFFSSTTNKLNKELSDDIDSVIEYFIKIKNPETRKSIIHLVKMIRKDAE